MVLILFILIATKQSLLSLLAFLLIDEGFDSVWVYQALLETLASIVQREPIIALLFLVDDGIKNAYGHISGCHILSSLVQAPQALRSSNIVLHFEILYLFLECCHALIHHGVQLLKLLHRRGGASKAMAGSRPCWLLLGILSIEL